ncbi:hypothetical protein KUA08_17255 [Komagataeibacter melomenusus]|uniref:hypothetical protein n=1 Tax=Komagataeibacter melomenusus TaxID=2766578 RepID=UPI001555D6A0|nr:hypothetical protein [Komagataeibacter melomenusus]MBV1832318.1 hypothetical protein [Komagataeibacter melomenusus]
MVPRRLLFQSCIKVTRAADQQVMDIFLFYNNYLCNFQTATNNPMTEEFADFVAGKTQLG